jgi:hypothetical protein
MYPYLKNNPPPPRRGLKLADFLFGKINKGENMKEKVISEMNDKRKIYIFNGN